MKLSPLTTLSILLAAFLTASSEEALAGIPRPSLRADAENAISQFKNSDPELKNFFENSAGFVVFPSAGRAGLFLGGAAGRGVVYEKGKPAGTARMTEFNAGPQIGGQAFTEVIFFETAEGLETFKQSRCELSAEAGAIAVKQGATLSAAYRKGVVVFIRPKAGLMAQVTVGGQVLIYEPMQ